MKILDGEILHGDHVVVDADKTSGKLQLKSASAWVRASRRRQSSKSAADYADFHG